jgi:hypothetical protein
MVGSVPPRGGLSPVVPRNPMAFCPHCSQSNLHAGGHPGCCFRDLAKPNAKEAGRDAASRMAADPNLSALVAMAEALVAASRT